MLCVTDITVVETQRDRIRLAHQRHFTPSARVVGSDPVQYSPVEEEMVHGKMFVNHFGKRVCIGMTRQVQEAIGLPLEVFQKQRDLIASDRATIADLQHETEDLRRAAQQAQRDLDAFRTAGLWSRLKYAVTGVMGE